ncbi:MAG: S8 family serine peptidase [Streptosporangiales bacterium]|nr:S8 family serine peptidase [Streptosporangiales bacterium]
MRLPTALPVAGVGVLAALALALTSTPAIAAALVRATVTLVTGDQVTVRGSGAGADYTAKPGPGRSGITFDVRRDGGTVRVVPSDAAPLLAEGRVDARLFDVPRLVTWEYDDASRTDVPLITEHAEGTEPRVTGARAVGGARMTDGLTAMRLPKAEAADAWRSLTGERDDRLEGGVRRLWLDGKVKASLNHSVPQVGAAKAWAAGYTGKGVTVAVLDTGIDTGHPDLAGKVVAARDFTGAGLADQHGHGTHVASTVAGSGKASGGTYKGVAPGARLASGKVLDADGFGLESWIVAGMQWASSTVKAKVVNLSLGGTDTPDVDPMEQAVNELTATDGTLFVVAAGNEGELGLQTITSPGSATSALTVGAVNYSDRLAAWSSRGALPDGTIKPDVTAPGVSIDAAGAGTRGYVNFSGTSMAAPHVAGAAAILGQRFPGFKGASLKAALMSTAHYVSGYRAYHQGTGRIDVNRARLQRVYTTSPNISANYLTSRSSVIKKTVTYHNFNPVPVTYYLSDWSTNTAGTVAPGGLFTVDRSVITIPANGKTSVTLTISGAGVPRGFYSGWLTAQTSNGNWYVRSTIQTYAADR